MPDSKRLYRHSEEVRLIEHLADVGPSERVLRDEVRAGTHKKSVDGFGDHPHTVVGVAVKLAELGTAPLFIEGFVSRWTLEGLETQSTRVSE